MFSWTCIFTIDANLISNIIDSYKDGNYDFTPMFSYIAPMLKKYDLRYCNQESTIGGRNLGISAYPGFNSPDEIGKTLVDMGFNMVSLANNHSLDKGVVAVNYSNEFWKDNFSWIFFKRIIFVILSELNLYIAFFIKIGIVFISEFISYNKIVSSDNK